MPRTQRKPPKLAWMIVDPVGLMVLALGVVPLYVPDVVAGLGIPVTGPGP